MEMNQTLCLVNFEHPYSDSTGSKQATAMKSQKDFGIQHYK